jgi:tetrahydromethanopterin S-methyltransferase subunit G
MNQQIQQNRGMVFGALIGLISFLLLFPLLGHAQEPMLQEDSLQQEEKRVVPLEKVAVLPFVIVGPQGPEQRVVKGLWGEFFFRTGEVPMRAGPEVTRIFYRQLNRLGTCELIPLAQAQAAAEGVDREAFRQDPRGIAQQIGKDLGLYAVVIGGVYRFEQREGSALGVQRPASSAFDAHLVRVSDKKVLWSGRFDETQHTLSENLLKVGSFLKGGAQWVTVERLTEIGVESVLRTFPTLTR